MADLAGRLESMSFGDENRGTQIGQSYGPIYLHSSSVEHSAESAPLPFASIPFRRDPEFVNRGDVVDQIFQRHTEPAGRLALVGLGGVGKSQLAIEAAHRIAEAHTDVWIFWIHASNRARIEEGFKKIASIVLPNRNPADPEVPRLVETWLSNPRNGRWVICIDSADNQDDLFGAAERSQPLASFLPQSSNGFLLITTRSKELSFKLTGNGNNMIEIGPMAQQDALSLLGQKLGAPSDSDEAAELVNELEFIPLAISQAAAYIREKSPRSSLSKYLAEFRKGDRKKVRLLEHDAGDLRRDLATSGAVLKTWMMSFDELRIRRPSAADLLSLMSFFDRQGIPEWVLKRRIIPQRGARDSSVANGSGDSEPRRSSDSDSSSDTTDGAEDEFEDDVAMLMNFCLITCCGDETGFDMHRLVQLSTRTWLKSFGQHDRFKEQFIQRMAISFPLGILENWTTCQPLFPHAQAALDYQPPKNCVEPWASLLHNAGVYAYWQGRYIIAEDMLSTARKAREEVFGESDHASLNSTMMFALAISEQGRWKEAETLQVQLVEVHETMFGPDHFHTLDSMRSLASTYWRQGRWAKAEKLQVRVMEACKVRFRANHPDTLASMSDLAATYLEQGHWAAAEELQVQMMEALVADLGADHPATLINKNNLARTYINLGRLEEAEKLAAQAVEAGETRFGVDHPEHLIHISTLAIIYWEQGRRVEAEKLEVQVMESCKTTLGVAHPYTLTAMMNLAITYKNQYRWTEAETLLTSVMRAQAEHGEHHPDRVLCMYKLAAVYEEQDRWEEAEQLYVLARKAEKRKPGDDPPPDTVVTYSRSS